MTQPPPRSVYTAPRRDRPRQPTSRLRVVRWLLLAVLIAGVFAAGTALGEALHDNPDPSRVRETHVRTLVPGTLPPEQATVTVTVGTP